MSTLHLNVFVDGYGRELAERWPVFEGLLPHRCTLRSVLGYTNTALPTIFTGRLPAEHGRFTLWSFAAHSSPFAAIPWLRWLPAAPFAYGPLRRRLDARIARSLRWDGYFSSGNLPPRKLRDLDYGETRDLLRPGGLGSVPTVFDRLAENRTPAWCSDWRRSEDENLEALEARIREGDLRWAFLALQSFDGRVHAWGTRDPRLGVALQGMRAAVERLLSAAESRGLTPRLNLFSDHGLADVVRTVDLRPVLREVGFGARGDQHLLDATMARFRCASDAGRERLRAALSSQPHGRLLEREELEKLGAGFDDERFGELIFLLDEGGILHPSHAARKPCAAMHGYHPDAPSMDAVLLSTHAPARRPSHIAELHDLLLEGVESENSRRDAQAREGSREAVRA